MGEPLFFPQWNRLKLDLFFHFLSQGYQNQSNCVFLSLEYQIPQPGLRFRVALWELQEREERSQLNIKGQVYLPTFGIHIHQFHSEPFSRWNPDSTFKCKSQNAVREPYLKNARPDPTFFNRAGKGSQTSFLFREKVFKRYPEGVLGKVRSDSSIQ